MSAIHLLCPFLCLLLLVAGCAEGDIPADDAPPTTDAYRSMDGGLLPASSDAAPSQGGIQFRRYTEQREQAYSFEAPAGWRVQAQIIRQSPTLYRTWDVIVSPDGQVRILGGLPERFLFVEPGPMTQMMGVSEGGTVNGMMHVARYQDPRTFARQHIETIARGCPDVQVTGAQERPDEAQRQEARARRQGDWVQGARVQAAEVRFTCQGPEGAVEGRIIASTIRMQSPGGGTTWVGGLRGFLAPPERAEQAYRIMEHAIASHEPNPQWKAQQRQAQQQQMQASQRAHQQRMAQRQAAFNAHQQRMAQRQSAFDAHQRRMADQQAVFDAGVQSWRSNQAAQDRMHDQFIGSIREETRVWDTNTGQSYDVPQGWDTYYIDQTGSSIVGTPGYVENPDPLNYDPMYEGYDYEQTGGDQ